MAADKHSVTSARIAIGLGAVIVVAGLVVGVQAVANASITGASTSSGLLGAIGLLAGGFALLYGAARRLALSAHRRAVELPPRPANAEPTPAATPRPESRPFMPEPSESESSGLPLRTRWVAIALLTFASMALIAQGVSEWGVTVPVRLLAGIGGALAVAMFAAHETAPSRTANSTPTGRAGHAPSQKSGSAVGQK